MLRCIDRDYEAASGDVLDDGSEPVFISQRATGQDVLMIRLRIEERVMTGSITEAAEGLELDDMVALFVRTYLGTLTGDLYRGRIDEVALQASEPRTLSHLPVPSRPICPLGPAADRDRCAKGSRPTSLPLR
jgi:hypothetical protein